MARIKGFPTWKHFLAMGGIFIAGSFIGALPLGLVGFVEIIRSGEVIDPGNMPDITQFVPRAWLSHLAPIMSAVPLVLCILYGWPRLGKPRWNLGFDRVAFLPGALAVAGTLLLANGVTTVAEYLPGYDDFAEAMQKMLVPGVGMAIAVIICAPVFEEALLRGIILRGLLRKTTPFYSILISGLCFGVMHVIPVHVFFASIVGFALGYVYYRTRSLGLVILIHLINNAASYLLGQTDMPASTEALLGAGMAGVLALAAGLTFVGLGMLYLLGSQYPLVPPPPGEYTTPEEMPVASSRSEN